MIRPVGQGAREPGTWLWLSFHKGRGILETRRVARLSPWLMAAQDPALTLLAQLPSF